MGDQTDLTGFSSVLPPPELAVVTAALWQDAVVWQALQQPALVKKTQTADGSLANWNPANLALAALDAGVSAEELRSAPDDSLDGALLQRALDTYNRWSAGAHLTADVANAGLVALALRERHRLGVDWTVLLERGSAHFPTDSRSGEFARAVLACLYGLVNDPVELLHALMAGAVQGGGLELACHCILANPQPETRMQEVMAGLLLDLSPEKQLDWLRLLQVKGRGALALHLAQALVDSSEDASLVSGAVSGVEMQRLQQHATLYAQAGNQDHAVALLTEAREQARLFVAALETQIANLGGGLDKADSPQAVWSDAQRMPQLLAELSLPQASRPWDGQLAEAETTPEHALLLLRRAFLAEEQGQRERAQSLARQGVALLPALAASGLDAWGNTGDLWQPARLVERLAGLDLPEEAAQVAEVAMSQRRVDGALLAAAGEVFEKSGSTRQAIEAARLACLLDTTDANSLRRLAALYEGDENWKLALQTRQQVLGLSERPSTQDQLLAANCALYAGATGGVIALCSQILDAQPEHGGAHGLLGLALMEQGQRDTAVEHLHQATEYAPEETRAWLALADVCRSENDLPGALKTLRAGVLAAPDSADLNYALARACLDSGQPSEALPYLWEASRLDASQAEVAWKLARTLHELGHQSEARQVIDQARWRWPQHGMVAAVNAEILLDAGKLEQAIEPLEVALAGDHPQPEWYLRYTRALLGLRPGMALSEAAEPQRERLIRAHDSLLKAVDGLPTDFEARLLLAEVLLAQGNSREAYERISALAEAANASQPGLRWRLQAGLGRAALALGEVETAVAALREAAQSRPEDLRVQQDLTEAFTQASLGEEAIRTARQALILDTENVENLSWFIDMMDRLGKPEETLTALETVTRLSPENPAFWNKLARVRQQRGEENETRQALETLRSLTAVEVDDLRRAARTYVLLGDRLAALDCLNQAMALETTCQPDLHYAASALLHQAGRDEEAVSVAQRALEESASPLAKVMLADVLSWAGRPLEALDCLESITAESLEQTGSVQLSNELLPGGWQTAAQSAAVVAARAALCALAAGDGEQAVKAVEQALQINAADACVRLLAAVLQRSSGDSVRALQTATLLPVSTREQNLTVWEQGLVALQAEIALDQGEDANAARLIEQHIETIPTEAHLLAVQARLLRRVNDLAGATAALQDALAARETPGLSGHENILAIYDFTEAAWDVYQASVPLACAEAALDLGQWQSALDGFAEAVEIGPLNAHANLRRARAYVICAEEQRLCTALRSEAHAPASHSQNDELVEGFERAISQAQALSGESDAVKQWQVRGQAVFQPALKLAPALARLAPSGENAAALLALLREVNNAAGAVRIAHHYPEDARVLVQLALCYYEVDALKGLECARRAVEQDASQPLAYAALAMLEQEVGNPEGALQALEKALAFWPEEPAWHAWQAELLDSLGETGQSLAAWEQALALQPASAEYALVVARKRTHAGDTAEAVRILERASDANPLEAPLWAALSEAYRMEGRMEEALSCASQATEINPQNPATYLASGEIALQMGRSDAALAFARMALECDPHDSNAVLFVARVLVQKGQVAEGLTMLEKAAPAMRGCLPVMMERANLIRRLYGAQVALPVFLELAQLFPQEPLVLSLLAQAQSECGDLKAAERTAYSAHHINPENPQLNFLLGRLQHASGQLDQAIHFLSEAIRQSPNEVEPYLELGQAYLERREHLQALATYQQAIQVSSRDHRPYYRAALVLRDCKDYVGAESMLRRAAELAPDDLNIRRQLGAVVALNLVHNTQEVNSPL